MWSFGLAYLMGETDTTGGNEPEWNSTALYVKHQFNKKFYAALRYEMWSQENTAGNGFSNAFYANDTNNEQSVDSITLTGSYTCEDAGEMRLELRQNNADSEIFNDEDPGNEDSEMTLTAAWIYTF